MTTADQIQRWMVSSAAAAILILLGTGIFL